MKEEEKNIIWASKLVIDGNVMRYKNSVVQMKNVSCCEIEKMPKDPYPLWAILGSQLSIIIIFVKLVKSDYLYDNVFIFAIIGFALCTMYLLIVFVNNQNKDTCLIFELNSGRILLFACDNVEFLKNAHKEIVKCFNYSDALCIIKFNDCTINNSQIGKCNEVNY